MKLTLPPDMITATRLTKEGKLSEATALLMRMCRGPAEAPETPPSPARKASGKVLIDKMKATDAEVSDEPSKLSAFIAKFQPRGVTLPVEGLAAEGLGDTALKSKPPVVTPAGAKFISATHAGEAGSRNYKLFVPGGYTGQKLPLVVMLHGCTQSPDDFAAGTGMNILADEQQCFVAYPAQSQSANAGKCWNWFLSADQQRGKGEPALVAGIARDIMSNYAIDPQRVYVAGLSAGGAAAAILGETYPDIFAAVGVHSGLACGAASDLGSALSVMRSGKAGAPARPSSDVRSTQRPIPTIVFHGDKDQTVHPKNGDQVINQLLGAGYDKRVRAVSDRGETGGQSFSRTCYFDRDNQSVLELWVVHGAGHAWSGGSRNGSYADPRGPDASREMLRFFLSHARTVKPN